MPALEALDVLLEVLERIAGHIIAQELLVVLRSCGRILVEVLGDLASLEAPDRCHNFALECAIVQRRLASLIVYQGDKAADLVV